MQRRHCLAALLASVAPDVLGATPSQLAPLEIEDLKLPGNGKFIRQARLLVEPHTAPERLLILLHGRGEADSVSLALKAWSHLYGLCEAYTRLRSPPLGAVSKEPRWDADRATQMNTTLATRPFRGFAVVCPATPNPGAFGNRSALYREFTEWLVSELVPAVRSKVPSVGDHIGLDGCSMGGALAFEVFLQRPDAFRSFGTVQAAIGNDRAAVLADRFAAVKAVQNLPKVQLLTSSGDPYRQANEHLSQHLRSNGIDATLEVIHGPHNQAWLRQMGTLAMLFWHDRQL